MKLTAAQRNGLLRLANGLAPSPQALKSLVAIGLVVMVAHLTVAGHNALDPKGRRS